MQPYSCFGNPSHHQINLEIFHFSISDNDHDVCEESAITHALTYSALNL